MHVPHLEKWAMAIIQRLSDDDEWYHEGSRGERENFAHIDLRYDIGAMYVTIA